jgi:hypothetical protein
MGLLKKLFGGSGGAGEAQPQPQSLQFHESETTAQDLGSRNAPRRELVQVVLRDTMRKHGIPSDWIDCRILSVVTRRKTSGMHVQFIVSKGQTRLLAYVQPFQDSFWEEIEKFEPRAREWLFSLAWQFDGTASGANRSMPGPNGWHEDAAQQAGDTQPPDLAADDLASDLKALYAIRDAAMSQSGEAAALQGQTGPSGHPKGPAGSW